MQFIFNEDSNLYGYAEQEGEQSFAFPSNIRQMGCMEDGIRIYVEDYVYTYLYQFAKSSSGKEKLAALAGRAMVVDGQEVIIISGAIQAKDTAQNHGVLSFTEKTWEYINNQMEVYFKGLTLVGWVHTQPGFGAFMMAQDQEFHREFFPESHQVLFVIDPLEKLDSFFIHNGEKTGLRAAKGYFVYYEKNKEMQDYMLDHNLGRQKMTIVDKQLYDEEEGKEDQENQEAIIEENNINERVKGKHKLEGNSRELAVKRVIGIREKRGDGSQNKKEDIMVSAIRKEGVTRRKPSQAERMDAAKDIRRVLQKRAQEADAESKTRVNVLVGVSGILCLTCLIMGSSMMSNINRLKRLETEIATVQHSYVAMAQKIESERAQVVFAAQNMPPPVQTAPSPQVSTAATTEAAPIVVPAAAPATTGLEANVVEEEAPKEEAPKEEAPKEEAPKEEAVAVFTIMDNYMVEEGDTLGRISLVYYGSQKRIGDIMKLNNIGDADSIRIGQNLKIPK